MRILSTASRWLVERGVQFVEPIMVGSNGMRQAEGHADDTLNAHTVRGHGDCRLTDVDGFSIRGILA